MTEWIKHDGGPCPVPPETEVEPLFKSGARMPKDRASEFYWPNITSYRIVSPPPPASPVRMVPKIVPGTYGIVTVGAHTAVMTRWLRIEENPYTANDFRDAARILTELAEAMEAGE